MPKLSIVIPCYYNELNIPVTTAELIHNETLFPADLEFEYILVDDGSKDNTFAELKKFHEAYPHKVKIVKLAGNVGSHSAVLAGLQYVTGDCCTMISADLQDPPELIVKMYDYWLKGFRLVLANREDREDSFGQKLFANTYHYLIRKLAIKSIPPGGCDFALFDKKLVDVLISINEKNTNNLYLLPWMGFDHVSIPYTRRKRKIGKSRWTASKKIKLFIDSFVSFSFFPIRAISFLGLILGIVAFIYGVFVLIAKLFGMIELQGWTAIMIVLLFVSAFQMLALGIIGEYVWRTLDAVRNRPNYIIDEVINKTKTD